MRKSGTAPVVARRLRAFTLTELLVAVAIVLVLATLLVGIVGHLRMRVRMIQAHTDLREITAAIILYRSDHAGACPPTRFSCSTRAAYELPVELGEYGLPSGHNRHGVKAVHMPDPFTGETYKFRAPGRAILNETTLVENGSRIWVPDGFPYDEQTSGTYYKDPHASPVRFAVWSSGPDPESPKFAVPGRLPVPRECWMSRAGDTGVIVHYEDAHGAIITSP